MFRRPGSKPCCLANPKWFYYPRLYKASRYPLRLQSTPGDMSNRRIGSALNAVRHVRYHHCWERFFTGRCLTTLCSQKLLDHPFFDQISAGFPSVPFSHLICYIWHRRRGVYRPSPYRAISLPDNACRHGL